MSDEAPQAQGSILVLVAMDAQDTAVVVLGRRHGGGRGPARVHLQSSVVSVGQETVQCLADLQRVFPEALWAAGSTGEIGALRSTVAGRVIARPVRGAPIVAGDQPLAYRRAEALAAAVQRAPRQEAA